MSKSTQIPLQIDRTNTLMLIGIMIGVLVGVIIDSIPLASVSGLVIGATMDYLRYHFKINT